MLLLKCYHKSIKVKASLLKQYHSKSAGMELPLKGYH